MIQNYTLRLNNHWFKAFMIRDKETGRLKVKHCYKNRVRELLKLKRKVNA